jgi:hypothetical protein
MENPKPAPKPRRSQRRPDPLATERFKQVVSRGPCIALGLPGHVCEGPLQAMHIVPRQTLRRRGLEDLEWDPDNGVNGCYRAHRRHDLAVEKIPRSLLPPSAIDWAARHGLLDALERHWP